MAKMHTCQLILLVLVATCCSSAVSSTVGSQNNQSLTKSSTALRIAQSDTERLSIEKYFSMVRNSISFHFESTGQSGACFNIIMETIDDVESAVVIFVKQGLGSRLFQAVYSVAKDATVILKECI